MVLLHDAHIILADPEQPPGLREVACAALVTALEENLPVPPGSLMAIWKWIKEQTPKGWHAAQWRLGEVYDSEVFTAALDAVREPASGTELRQVALDLLAGSAYAPMITDDLLMDIVDRQHVEPERLPRLVENIHKARGIPVDVLRVIRDRWAASSNPATREAAVEIGALVAEHDDAFWLRMLADPNDDVRISAVGKIAKHCRVEFALEAIQEALGREVVMDVRGELHRGMTTVIHRGEREG